MVEKQKEFNDGKEASKSEDAPEEGEATKEKNSGLLGLHHSAGMCYAWVFVPQPSDVVKEGLAQRERDHDMPG